MNRAFEIAVGNFCVDKSIKLYILKRSVSKWPLTPILLPISTRHTIKRKIQRQRNFSHGRREPQRNRLQPVNGIVPYADIPFERCYFSVLFLFFFFKYVILSSYRFHEDYPRIAKISFYKIKEKKKKIHSNQERSVKFADTSCIRYLSDRLLY